MVDGLSAFVANHGCIGGVDTLRWFETTDAGAAALDYFSVFEFATELQAEFVLISGDVGLADMHDGQYYATGSETAFLESFSAVPFRYDRLPDRSVGVGENPDEGREGIAEFRSRQVTLLAHFLLTGDTTAYPKIVESSVETDATSFRARALTDPAAEAVRLWWSYSDERSFNDEGNARWVAVEMVQEGDAWVSPSVTMPRGRMIGWYVEAENTLHWEGLTASRRDASPQRFFNEFPPRTCPRAPPDCSPPGIFLRGDCDGSGVIEGSVNDAIANFQYCFAGRIVPCKSACDADGDGNPCSGVTDGLRILLYVFQSGNPPPTPFPDCGTAEGEVDCETQPMNCQ